MGAHVASAESQIPDDDIEAETIRRRRVPGAACRDVIHELRLVLAGEP